MFKPKTRTIAIDEKCKDCAYDPANGGNWRQQVEACPCESSCALWEFRPVTNALIEKRKEEKVAKMSPSELEKYRKKQNEARERFKSAR